MVIHLDHVLRTGDWGPVRPGSSRAEVEHLLGVPEGWESGSRGPGSRCATRWHYGAYQLVFREDESLRSIFNESPERLDDALGFRVEAGLLAGGAGLSLLDAADTLRAAGIRVWAWRHKVTGAAVLTTEGGVSLQFFGPEGEMPAPGWTLSALVVDGQREPEPRLVDAGWAAEWAGARPTRERPPAPTEGAQP